MKYVEVVADAGNSDTIAALAEKLEARDVRLGVVGEAGMQAVRLLVPDDKLHAALDTLQHLLVAQPSARILVLPVEISLPRRPDDARREEDSAVAARESLYDSVERNARLDRNYIVLVVLSTTVAAIGLIENNVAVVIGAMVIAPLLGPNLAFGLGTALGDIALMRMSASTAAVGIAVAISLTTAIGALWPFDVSSPEITARTDVGMDSVALALAAGAAAALSLTTGLPSGLVGAAGGNAGTHVGPRRYSPCCRCGLAARHQRGMRQSGQQGGFLRQGYTPAQLVGKRKIQARHGRIRLDLAGHAGRSDGVHLRPSCLNSRVARACGVSRSVTGQFTMPRSALEYIQVQSAKSGVSMPPVWA